MKINKPYRLVAHLISVTLFLGVVFPVVSQASMFVYCETMMETTGDTQASMHDHESMSHSSMEMNPVMDMNTVEDCWMTSEPMEHHQTNKEERSALNHCEMAIYCNCFLTDRTLHKKALALQQLKIPILPVSSIETDLLKDHPGLSPIPIYFSSSYSPPLLFLANQSLLL